MTDLNTTVLGPTASRKWVELRPLFPTDPMVLDQLASYCAAFETFELATADITAHGVVIEDDRGKKIRNPACSVSDSAAKQMTRIWRFLENKQIAAVDENHAKRVRLLGNPNTKTAALEAVK